jgi:hypothetical protein
MKPYIVGGKYRFKTLDEAKAYANRVYQRTGLILSVEKKP